MRDKGCKLKQERKNWICGSQAVENVVHRAVQFLTPLGDTQYPGAKSPEQSGLTKLVPLGAGSWTRDLQRSLQT